MPFGYSSLLCSVRNMDLDIQECLCHSLHLPSAKAALFKLTILPEVLRVVTSPKLY